RYPEVLRHAADQEPRFAARRLQQESQDGRGRGLAVGTGDGQRVAAGQYVLQQPLRAGGVVQAGVEHVLDRRVAARQRVADDDLVDVGRDVPGPVALAERDAEGFELGRHRRIDRLVAAFDLVAEFARERGDAAHEGAGDAKDVELQAQTPLNDWNGLRRSTSRTAPTSLPACGRNRSSHPTTFPGAIASTMRANTSSSEPTPSTTVSWPWAR